MADEVMERVSGDLRSSTTPHPRSPPTRTPRCAAHESSHGSCAHRPVWGHHPCGVQRRVGRSPLPARRVRADAARRARQRRGRDRGRARSLLGSEGGAPGAPSCGDAVLTPRIEVMRAPYRRSRTRAGRRGAGAARRKSWPTSPAPSRPRCSAGWRGATGLRDRSWRRPPRVALQAFSGDPAVMGDVQRAIADLSSFARELISEKERARATT